MIPIRFFGTVNTDGIALNEYVVTKPFVYPRVENEKRVDIVLIINDFPVVVDELNPPVRNAITWLDGASDISDHEKSMSALFTTNIFNFASEGKCYRYGSINMPVNMWRPWHTSDHKSEGTHADVKISIADMLTPAKVTSDTVNSAVK